MILSTVLTVLALVLAVVSIALTPRDTEIAPADGGEYSAICALDGDRWVYTTKTGAFLMREDETTEAAADVVGTAKESFGIDAGEVNFVYCRTGGDSIYVATTTSSGGYLFRLNYSLEIQDYAQYNGVIKRALESDDGKDLYVVYGVNASVEISRYTAENLSSGAVKTGYIFSMINSGDEYRLKNYSSFRVLSMLLDNDTLYVVHPNGIIATSTDFAMNSEDPFDYGELRVNKDEFDLSQYCVYISSGTIRGCAYVKADERFYTTGDDNLLHYIDLSSLTHTRPNTVLKDLTVENVVLPAIPQADYASLLFDESANSAFVIYQSSNLISKFDFTEKELVYTIKADFGVSNVIQNASGSRAYYFFFNANRATSTLLKRCEVTKNLLAPTLQIVLLISAIVGVICAVWATLSWLCVFKAGFTERLKKLGRDIAKNKWIYVSLLVPVALLIAFCYYETIASVITSFFDYTIDNPTRNWNNFKNYIDIFTDAEKVKSFLNMLFFLFFDLVTSIVPPIVFAFFLITMISKKYSGFTRTMLFIPGVIPSIAGLLIWSTGIFGQYGVVSTIVRWLGGEPINLLASSGTARWALVFMGFPYVGGYLIFYGAMMNIPGSYHEAAELEGTGIMQRLFMIDIPLIAPQIKYIFVTMFIHSVQNFARTYTTVGDNLSINVGVITPVHYMYRNVVSGDYGIASAYATLIFIFLFFATFMTFKKKKEELGVR